MPPILSAFAAGLLFGLGLVLSQMVNPAKVLDFLDVLGSWDPSLALVMAGAVAVSTLGSFLARRRGIPVLAPRLEIPTRRDLEPRLLLGAAIFGVGWGLVGLCPGPAWTALSFASWRVLVFVASMLVGMALFRAVSAERPNASYQQVPTAPSS